jgi:hypothetical protein
LSHLALVDGIPIIEHLGRIATAYWHWFFFAQPDIPGRVINADPDSWYQADPVRIWRRWADDVRGHGIDSGHHMAEKAPAAPADALGDFLATT